MEYWLIWQEKRADWHQNVANNYFDQKVTTGNNSKLI